MFDSFNGFPVVCCDGNGQGICVRCRALYGQPIHWMTMLYRSDGFDGLLCASCLRDLIKSSEEVSK